MQKNPKKICKSYCYVVEKDTKVGKCGKKLSTSGKLCNRMFYIWRLI
jgi:hypothetical protein